MPNAYGFDPYKAQADEVESSRRYAETMRQQSATPIQPYTSGGIAGPISWTQGLAKMLEGANAGGWRRKAEEDAKALQGQREQRRGADMSLMAQALRGRQATPGGLTEDASGNVTQADALPGQTPMQSFGQALPMMQDPGAIQMGFNLMGMQQKEREGEENRAARLEERAMMLEAQAQNAAASAAERAQARQEAAQLRQQLQRDQQNFQMQMSRENRSNRVQPQPQILQTAEGPMQLVNGQAVPITGPSGQQVRPAAGRGGHMTATAQKELIETEEQLQGGQAALELFKQARGINDQAMGFTGAGAVASAGSLLPEALRPATVDATQNLDNMLQSAALPQLKAIFGGMPTEGERKILLDVQGSSNKPPAVRKAIFDRAEQAIQARLRFAGDKAKRLREGTYFGGEGLPSLQQPGAQPAAGASQPPPGVAPDIWNAMTPKEKALFQ